MPDHSPLTLFHPLVRRWFEDRLGHPTPIQRSAWPLIAGDNHVLITAPTGSGKTLAAFLWALDLLIGGRIHPGHTQILYISPLKALNNDVRRNLMRPLDDIRRLFDKTGTPFPQIRVATRSGDTPSHERRQMIRRPPDILITTPESLHLMLSSRGGRTVLGQIQTVILDEVHAVVGNKRGTLLMSAVDRLVPLCGEFQRIALSATINPEDHVAAFVAGFTLHGDPRDPIYTPREIRRCRDDRRQQDIIRIRIPRAVTDGDDHRKLWDEMADIFRQTIDAHRSTLIFTNSRRLCEKLTFLINADRPQPVAYAHHGSLSKALRLDVEKRLKAGTLKAIVATASLELGIDIGRLDQVIMVQSPSSISSAVQRIGRSGHGVGEASRAQFFATHAIDAVIAATLARAVLQRDIEPVRSVACPLDVLAQILVSMTGVQTWDADELYATLRASYPFHELKRSAFDLVVEMLAGRYGATRIVDLQPKIAFDRLENTLTAKKGALLSLYTSGGVIPDRGYFTLRHQESGARIGELDEEFVWEAKKGQVFTLGTQNWCIARVTHNDVFVKPAHPKAPAPPFWRAEGTDRDFFLADKIGRFLESAQRHLNDPGLTDEFRERYRLDKKGARYLVDFLMRQRQQTGCALPHRHHLVVERMPTQKGGAAMGQVVIHTFWGGRVNRPFALALESAWDQRYGHSPSIFPTNEAVYLLLPQAVAVDDILGLVAAEDVYTLVRDRLEGSGIFGARFRECAARALLLTRQRFGQRMPLWLSRQQSQRFLDAVGRFADFPIVLETWRTCLQDDFDMAALKRVLGELEGGEIAWTAVETTSPSPMALSGSWRLINEYMYADDRQQGKVKTRLSRDLLQEVVFTPELRPMVDAQSVDEFSKKRQRVYPGYAPDSPMELLEWIKERLLIPWPEWQLLLDRIGGEGEASAQAMLDTLGGKLVRLIPGSAGDSDGHLIVAAEMKSVIARVLYEGRGDVRWLELAGQAASPHDAKPVDGECALPHATDILGQWLRFYGPVTSDFIVRRLGVDAARLSGLLETLVQDRRLVSGLLIHGQKEVRVCHADNFESLLRLSRRRRTAVIEPREIDELAPLLARFQGLVRIADDPLDLAACLQSLMGVSLPAALWETEILPARIKNYDPRQLDHLMQATPMMWIGGPGRQITFCLEDDLDLMIDADGKSDPMLKKARQDESAALNLFADPRARYPLSALLGDPPRRAQDVLSLLWSAVWKGLVTNDAMAALRRRMGKTINPAAQTRLFPGQGRGAVQRFRRKRPGLSATLSSGSLDNWRLVRPPAPPDGLVESEELVKDRVRLLLDRYGLVFRHLLDREAPLFRWSAIFRALRLMELSGEITAGYFFKGIPGPQFASTAMLRLLRQKQPDDFVYWINAMDPASVCGLKIDVLKGRLPRRVASTHLVYWGRRLVMVSRRNGKVLSIHLPVDHPRLVDCLDLFDHLLGRAINPLRAISIETINEKPVAESPFLNLLRQRFDTIIETRALTLYRRLAR